MMPYAYGDPYYVNAAFPSYPYARELNPSEEMNMLKEQSRMLQSELNEIQERIGTLEKAQAQDKK